MPPVTEDSTLPRATLKAIEEALRAFARAYRAYHLYLPNNPTRVKQVEDAKHAFAALWPHVDEFSLLIAETAFVVDGHEVYHDDERGSSGLPWLLYRDGLRRLDFAVGFEDTELEVFLDILHRSKSAPPDEDDLITMLWVADLKHLHYRNVELMVDFDSVETEGDGGKADQKDPTAAQAEDSAAHGDGPAPEFVIVEDFESSLYFLDQNESAHLTDELRREYETDGRVQVICALYDIVEGQDDVAAQVEACGIIDQLIVESLAEGEYGVTATILREARLTLSRRTDIDSTVQNALSSLPVRLSEAHVISQLLQTIDSGDRAPATALLEDLFAELRPTAIIPLLAWYHAAQVSPTRHAIERAIARIATRHTQEFVRTFDYHDTSVVRAAVLIARTVPSPPLIAPLTRLLSNSDHHLRQDVVAALSVIASPGAMKVLESAIDDGHRDVRIAVLKAIAAQKYSGALPRLQGALQRKTLRNTDLSEKMAFFEAFGALCGEQGVPALDGVLNGRGLLGRREPPEMRACAAHALGLVGSHAAHQALSKSAESPDAIVRSAVGRALRAIQ